MKRISIILLTLLIASPVFAGKTETVGEGKKFAHSHSVAQVQAGFGVDAKIYEFDKDSSVGTFLNSINIETRQITFGGGDYVGTYYLVAETDLTSVTKNIADFITFWDN